MGNRDSLRRAAPTAIVVWGWLWLCSPALALTGAAGQSVTVARMTLLK